MGFAMVAALAAATAPAAPAGAQDGFGHDDYFPPAFSLPTMPCRDGDKVGTRANPVQGRFYTQYLKAAGEPDLHRRAPSSEQTVVRFLWLRTFHAPIIVRLELGNARLHAVRLSGQAGYGVGRVEQRLSRRLTKEEVRSVETMMAQGDRAFDPPAPPSCDAPPPLDGAQWLVESVDGKGYRLGTAFSPRGGAVRRIGLALLALTGWPIEPVY